MELRKDYILDRWVIISTGRASRPRQFAMPKIEKKVDTCFFCPGNESLTPPEIGRIPDGNTWLIRWFPNKFPAVEKSGRTKITKKGFLTSTNPYGTHEVIAETPDHDKQLWDLGQDHITKLLKVYTQRITELSKEKLCKYVIVFKNHGASAGTSLIHSHTQVVSISVIPPLVKEESAASKKSKSCPFCKIIKEEAKTERFIFQNDSFIAIAPYASRFNYEAWIFPKTHRKSITEFTEKEYNDCADCLSKILGKLKSINADYNFLLHYSPKGGDLHFHIEILPRLNNWAGFEFHSGIIINSVTPEDAAQFYKT